MKLTTARSLLPAVVVGVLVSCYWFLAFWAAATTPLHFGSGHAPSDPWQSISPIRDSGLQAGFALWDESHPLKAIPLFDRAPFEVQLATLAFCYGLAAMVGAFVVTKVGWWIWCRRVSNN